MLSFIREYSLWFTRTFSNIANGTVTMDFLYCQQLNIFK